MRRALSVLLTHSPFNTAAYVPVDAATFVVRRPHGRACIAGRPRADGGFACRSSRLPMPHVSGPPPRPELSSGRGAEGFVPAGNSAETPIPGWSAPANAAQTVRWERGKQEGTE